MKTKGKYGAALRADGTQKAIFGDHEWESVFDELIRVVTRTSLVLEITGSDLTPKRAQEVIRRRYMDLTGTEPERPRGLAQKCTSANFLKTNREKYDAAYLMSLHFAGSTKKEYQHEELNHLRATSHMLEVYRQYRNTCYAGRDPRLSFESYYILLKGIHAREVDMRDCRECGSGYPLPHGQLGEKCPVCESLGLQMEKASTTVQRRVSNLANEKHGSVVSLQR